jgi:hypothetical protein
MISFCWTEIHIMQWLLSTQNLCSYYKNQHSKEISS